jgi:hypothetical protein
MNGVVGGDAAARDRHAGRTVSSSRDEASATTTYEVLVRGRLGDALVADLGARCFEPRRGKTLIVVDVIDQSHLHGVLTWLQDQNIEIERVNPV